VAGVSLFERVVAQMSDPSFYSPRPTAVEVRETHVSLIFLAGERAYKIKKPVRMPFLDYSTLERRQRFCREEVRLNRRFATDIYLGVQSIVEQDSLLVLADVDDSAAQEYAVVMRRFDEDATLEHMVERRAADQGLAERVGARVAELHVAAPRAPDGSWTPAYLAERLDENFDTTHPEADGLVDEDTYDTVRRYSYEFVQKHEDLLERRIAEGMVRELHGDLRAEHMVVEDGGLSIIDCLEFDVRLRRIDVAADLAFLTMDLERLGAGPLAAAAVRAYLERTGDADLKTLLPFYACYVAWLRGTVTVLRIRQLAEGDPARPALEKRAHALFELSLRLAFRAHSL
jgi:aminoglycoside phosphotransferase family enzyme